MKVGKKLIGLPYVLTGVLFLPVLFCVIFIGNHMDYYEGNKVNALLPNYVFFAAAVAGFALICLFAWAIGRKRLAGKAAWIADGLLALLFLLLFFVNVRIARETAFKLPWDIMVVTTQAQSIAEGEPLGYSTYFSMYRNNIPILYILKELYLRAAEGAGDSYTKEFLWIQVNCALISIGGFFCCLTVKKFTKELVPTIAAFLLYVALVGMTPWKIAPYTDVYGIAFPAICVYFYVCYREAQKAGLKYLFAALALTNGVLGGFIKPSAHIVIVAILAVELTGWAAGDRGRWRYILAEIGLTVVLLFARGACMDYMMEDMGLDFNPEIEAGWQHYLYMGLNEESTGSYSAEDGAIFGEFQTSRKERNDASIQRAFGRMAQRGLLGSVYFWLRKMVMVFNDGTFGWSSEVWIYGYYPEDLAGNGNLTQALRGIFWPGSAYTGRFNAFCQLVWIFCMLGICCICLCPKEQQEKYAVLVVSFLGIFCYQMLFEARARYLVVFLPLLCVISVCGMWQGICRIHGWMSRRLPRKETTNEERNMTASV